MSQSQDAIEIIDVKTGDAVTAILHSGLDELEVIDVETAWSPARLEALRKMLQRGVTQLPQHVHWNWAVKAVRNPGLLAVKFFGIEANGHMQGLMRVWLSGKDARLAPDKGKPLVYVDFIETAPWNAKEYTATPAYKGVGVRLIQAAARQSLDEGYSGRVGLHSLPQAVPFYTGGCEMTSLGPDSSYENLVYFELTAAKVADLFKK